MARVELEVDRNVLELTTLLPDPPEIDRRFYAEVWQPQEIRHGLILDELQVHLGRPAAEPDLTSLGVKMKVLGALAHLDAFQDVCRMLYYLTGMATERSAVLAYNLLHDGVLDDGRGRRRPDRDRADQAPGARPLRLLPAVRARAVGRSSPPGSGGWCAGCAASPSPRSAPTTPARQADFGDMMATLGIDRDVDDFAGQISRVERELLWAHHRGLKVPPYVARPSARPSSSAARVAARIPAPVARSGSPRQG